MEPVARKLERLTGMDSEGSGLITRLSEDETLPEAIRETFARLADRTAEEIGEREASQAALAERDRRLANVALRQEYQGSCGLPDSRERQTLESFRPSANWPNQLDAWRLAKRIVDLAPEVPKGVCFYGKPGRGKSHLLRAVVWGCVCQESPVRAFYVNCLSLEAALKAERRSSEPGLMDRALRASVLGLDDIEKAWAGDAAVWVRVWIKELLDAIDAAGSPVVIATSNAGLDRHREELGEQDWLFGRLVKLVDFQEVDGENWRLREIEDGPWWTR